MSIKPETQAEKFIQVNKKHRFVWGAWLNKNKHDVTHPDESEYFRVRLENGQTFTLTKEAHRIARERGHELR